MSYADQSMSGNRITAFIIVALIHIVVIYALVTGLAYEGYKKVMQRVTAVDIKEEVKKEPPPPPKKLDIKPPPLVVPPPKMNMTTQPAVVQTVTQAPPPPPPIVLAPPPPAAPPPPRFQAKGAAPKGRQGDWANTNDYPSRALRENAEGTTRFRVSIGPDGRVTDCQVTSSSGNSELDSTTCSLITRRARFTPAMDGEGQPTTGTFSSAVRWQIPKD
jgi:protein TonB